MPEHFPPFPTAEQFNEYLHMFVEHYQLQKYIHLNHKITKVSPASDFEENGCWDIRVESPDKPTRTEQFDAVIIASGHYVRKFRKSSILYPLLCLWYF